MEYFKKNETYAGKRNELKFSIFFGKLSPTDMVSPGAIDRKYHVRSSGLLLQPFTWSLPQT